MTNDISDIITIKDIARKADVSIGTVDRVLHNRGRVAETTALKVKKIINDLGYKPNIFASRLSRSKIFNFAVLMPECNQDSKYWKFSIQGIQRAEKELSRYHVSVKYFFYNRYSVSRFNEISDALFSSNIDGILIAPSLQNAIKEFIDKLPASVPYVFFNTYLKDLSPLAFIGQDSFQSGVVCGKLMKLIIQKPSTIAVIITVQNDLHIRNRAQGFLSQFSGEKDFVVKEYEFLQLKNKSATEEMFANIFMENKDLHGIFVTNVSVHYAAEYIENKVRYKKIFLIGYDLIQKNLHFLKNGTIDFLISQKPEQQGYEGIYTLYKHVVLHDKCEIQRSMPIDIITKENVDYYL